MTGKILIWLLATVLLTTVYAEAQQPKKVPHVGVLAGGSAVSDAAPHRGVAAGTA
jgi:hypothetical protein